MKRFLAFLVASVMVFLLSGCVPGINKGAKLSDELKEKIRESWTEYLIINEKRWYCSLWASEYIEDYCYELEVESYRKALAATESVAATLLSLEMPQFNLTQQDYEAIAESGADLSFIEMEFAAIESSIDTMTKKWQTLTLSVISESLWEYGNEYLQVEAELQKREAELNFQYLYNTTNYILLMLGDKDFSYQLREDCPQIIGEKDFVDNTEEIEEAAALLNEDFERLVEDQATLVGIGDANMEYFEYAAETGDYSEIYSLCSEWCEDAFPVLLPSMENPQVYSYRMSDSTGEAEWTVAGEELEDTPEGVVVQYEGIDKQDVREYIETLAVFGFEPVKEEGNLYDSNDYKYIYSNGENTFAFYFEEGTGSLYLNNEDEFLCTYWCAMSLAQDR